MTFTTVDLPLALRWFTQVLEWTGDQSALLAALPLASYTMPRTMGFLSITHLPPGYLYHNGTCHHHQVHLVYSLIQSHHCHNNDDVPRVIGRLSGQKALVNCIALEENGSEDFVASGSTDTTVRVGTIITLLSLLLQWRVAHTTNAPPSLHDAMQLTRCNATYPMQQHTCNSMQLTQSNATHTT